ncbi:hypothetical protein [Nocardia terpenica]|uniref:hypothetical protein n=1 Tax=Nocardia terpenica TaxID=455432 RepID=UPI0018E06881|nr:hypothetical protein [Nocardia terpenica]
MDVPPMLIREIDDPCETCCGWSTCNSPQHLIVEIGVTAAVERLKVGYSIVFELSIDRQVMDEKKVGNNYDGA